MCSGAAFTWHQLWRRVSHKQQAHGDAKSGGRLGKASYGTEVLFGIPNTKLALITFPLWILLSTLGFKISFITITGLLLCHRYRIIAGLHMIANPQSLEIQTALSAFILGKLISPSQKMTKIIKTMCEN